MTTALSTTAAKREFLQLFNRLCVALREPADDTGVTQRTYYDALSDVPLRALEDGAETLMKQAGRRFFPGVPEWREAALAAQAAELRKALTVERDPWKVECGACDDTGWEAFHCPGDSTCGRQRPHAAHTYVIACTCRPHNRTYQRHVRTGN